MHGLPGVTCDNFAQHHNWRHAMLQLKDGRLCVHNHLAKGQETIAVAVAKKAA